MLRCAAHLSTMLSPTELNDHRQREVDKVFGIISFCGLRIAS
jgi:hypothetical protein